MGGGWWVVTHVSENLFWPRAQGDCDWHPVLLGIANISPRTECMRN